MKSLILFSILLALSCSVAFSQEEGSEESSDLPTEEMAIPEGQEMPAETEAQNIGPSEEDMPGEEEG